MRRLLPPEAPFFIVVNASSGSKDGQGALETIDQELTAAGRRFEFFVAARGAEIEVMAQRAAERAERDAGAVVAVGGDGTINAATRATLPTGRPLGIVPHGTFNYTTRAHGIPGETRDAARALVDARIAHVQVGVVNERPFLVNAGVGLHPEILEDREAYKARLGRYRAVAFGAGLSTLLREHRQLLLEIEHDRERELVRTPSLFVGNNALQFEQTGLEQAENDVEHRRLAAVLVKPVSTWTLLTLGLRGALGRLGEDERVRTFGFRRMIVNPFGSARRKLVKLATDGEVTNVRPPLVFSISPARLPLLVPARPVPAP
jgi:diacylglycerol kinase family enzyme